MCRCLGVCMYRTDQDEAGRAGGEHVLRVVPVPLLGAAVCHQVHAEADRVVVRGLLGVADIEADVVEALDREGIGGDVVLDRADQLVGFDCVDQLIDVDRVGDPVRSGTVHGLSHLVRSRVRWMVQVLIVAARWAIGQLVTDWLVILYDPSS